nr:TPA_asm: hypothetical protein [Triaenorhabdovirus 1]
MSESCFTVKYVEELSQLMADEIDRSTLYKIMVSLCVGSWILLVLAFLLQIGVSQITTKAMARLNARSSSSKRGKKNDHSISNEVASNQPAQHMPMLRLRRDLGANLAHDV